MAAIIKNGEIVDDRWLRLTTEQIEADGLPADGPILVPLPVWLARREALLARGEVAVWLAPGEEPEALVEDLDRLPLIAIDFPVFRDGRGYSYARELRTRFGYHGELRAIGDVLRDQLFYLSRVGFNAFAVREDRNLEDALKGLKDFSVTYQGDTQDPRPIYRR